MDLDDVALPDSGGIVDGASVGNVLLALHNTKLEIIDEIRKRTDALHKTLGERLDAMSTSVVQKVLSGVTAHSALNQRSTSRSRASDEKKRKGPAPLVRDTIAHFDVLYDKEKTGFLVQWTVIATVLSFAQAYPAASSWIPAAREYLETDPGLFANASGLSVLFFSVENDHKWRRYHGKIGKLWSFVVRSSITTAILNVRVTEFDIPNAVEEHARTVPPWLSSFGGKRKTAAIVSEIVQCLETTDEMAKLVGDEEIAIRRKRIRRQGTEPADEFEAERDYSVKHVRSAMLRVLSYGRAEARKILVGSIMFLVDKIRSYPTVEDAEGDGYEVIFHPASVPEEGYVPSSTSQTIWDIPLASTRVTSEDELRDKNNKILKDLSDRFPSLHVTLRYKREVKVTGQAGAGPSAPLFWAATEEVSLHELAATLLTASLSAKSIKSVIQTTGLSIRAIHILAHGLRGFIKQCLHIELNELEKKALGGVTCELDEKTDGDQVSTTPSTGKSAAAFLQAIRNSKLKMSHAAYCAELDKERAARLVRETSVHSEGGQVDRDFDRNSDLEESWLEAGN